jgi:AAA family ATP:ADP antiporter
VAGLFSRETRARIAIRPGELRIVLLAAGWFFFVLAGYSVLRPLREQMGVAGGVSNLPWLFLCTLGVMLLVNPLYGAAVSRLPRGRFIPLVYRFFMSHLLVFFGLLMWLPVEAQVWVGRAFFVWLSVFNLFVISVFWSFLAENFASAAAKRLYAWIAVGGTLGSVLGSALTWGLSRLIEQNEGLGESALPWLLILSFGLLELAVRFSRRLGTTLGVSGGDPARAQEKRAALGGGAFEGLLQVLRSPYLLRMCLYLMCYSITGTLLYFMQADIVRAAFSSRAEQTQAFAFIDLATQVVTLLSQLFLTPRLLASVGVGRTLGILPLTTAFAFFSLALAPIFPVLVVSQVLRRSARYAVSKPAREVLFSVVARSEKYKAKAVIDTFVYRSGDVLGAGARKAAEALALGLIGLAACALPITAAWALLGLSLGREQQARAAAQGDEAQPHG